VLSRTPWTPAPKVKPPRYKITRERRRTLVDRVATGLRKGEPTVFALSATCRHNLRRAFIVEYHWPWIVADIVAARIVRQALDRVGARVPSWEEGQRYYAQADLFCAAYCVNCGALLLNRRDARFCGRACSNAHWAAIKTITMHDNGRAYGVAARRISGGPEW
jgi:hypothetical protein